MAVQEVATGVQEEYRLLVDLGADLEEETVAPPSRIPSHAFPRLLPSLAPRLSFASCSNARPPSDPPAPEGGKPAASGRSFRPGRVHCDTPAVARIVGGLPDPWTDLYGQND